MSRFPEIIKTGQVGHIPLHSDLGMDILIEEIYGCISESKIENDSLSSDQVKRQIDRWLFSFETNPQIIFERQAVVAYALKNPAFIKAVDNLGLYPNQALERDDKFTRFTGMMRRFETFAESIFSLREALDGDERPDSLNGLFLTCKEMHERIKVAESHLNPEFELRIEVEGRFGRGVILNILSPNRRDKCEFYYVLVNKHNNGIQRGETKSSFGIFTYRRDYFLEGLEKSIEETLERTIKKRPHFKRVYSVNGVLTYDQLAEIAQGELHFTRDNSKEEGVFSISFRKDYDDTVRSIIEMSRFSHNYQVVSPFEGVISDFEDTILELKALSAIIRFLNIMQRKGFPLSFPETLQADSQIDLKIETMYHPLLAYFSKPESVVPNEIATTTNQNVRLITGANNNGKTTYITALGLNQVLFQVGMPVVAKAAKMKLKDKILTHYVRPGDIKTSQSRFAHECDRILKLIQEITHDSLVLCDELFTGTAPQDGEIVSNLVLTTLIKTGATLFFITHYHGLGDTFRDSPYVEQLCCKLDHSQNPSAYTYKIKPGISGDSDGLIVASEYGVNKKNLENLLEQKARRGDFKLR
jgi:DNA mismatch repair ATPase MutS